MMNSPVRPVRLAAAMVVVAPVLFDPWGWAPFGPVKWTAVSVAAMAFVATALARPFALHRASAIGWVAFVGWMTLASATGADPLHAWIGTPDRHLGWATWVLFGLVFAAGQALGTRADRRTVARAAVVALVGIGLVAVTEAFGVLPPAGASGRLGGPFGSAAYLGAAVCLLAPVTASAAVVEQRAWRWAAGAATLGGFIAVVGSGTRAALVGLGVTGASIVAARHRVGGTVAPARIRSTPWRTAAVAMVGLAATAIVIVGPLGQRSLATVDFDDSGSRGRVDEWIVASRVLSAHPVVGVGPEGYRVVFPRFVDDSYARRYGRAVVPDRAHDVFLDVGVSAGLPGLLLAAAGIGWLGWVAWRAMSNRDVPLVGIGSGVLAYLVQQLFLFPIAELDPVLWLLAGLLTTTVARGARLRFGGPAVAIVAATLTVALAVVGVADVVADRRLARSGTVGSSQAASLAEQATTLRPDSIRYWFEASRTVADVDPRRSLELIDRARDLSPGDPILRLAELERLVDLVRRTGEPRWVDTMTTKAQAAVSEDPHNPAAHLLAGIAAAMVGDLEQAESAFVRTVELDPDSDAGWNNLALVFEQTGRLEEAAAARAEAKEGTE